MHHEKHDQKKTYIYSLLFDMRPFARASSKFKGKAVKYLFEAANTSRVWAGLSA